MADRVAVKAVAKAAARAASAARAAATVEAPAPPAEPQQGIPRDDEAATQSKEGLDGRLARSRSEIRTGA